MSAGLNPMIESVTKLGIIAGQGDLPTQILEEMATQGTDIFVLGFKGQFEDKLRAYPHEEVALGQIQAAIDVLRAQNVTHVVMAGRIKRPSLLSLKLDKRGRSLLKRAGFGALGDDRLLTMLVGELEGEGFTVLSTKDVLPGLTVTAQVLSQRVPDEGEGADIAYGLDVLRALSPFDVGQAVIVQQGTVIGIEGAEGTDGLIARYKAIAKDGPAGVLVKAAKDGQSKQADLPTIGPETVQNAADAGLAGIAVSADTTQIISRAASVELADQVGLFLKVV